MNDNKYEETLSKASKDILENDLESLDFYKGIKYVEPDVKRFICNLDLKVNIVQRVKCSRKTKYIKRKVF